MVSVNAIKYQKSKPAFEANSLNLNGAKKNWKSHGYAVRKRQKDQSWQGTLTGGTRAFPILK